MDVNDSVSYFIVDINGPSFAVVVGIELILAFIPIKSYLFIVVYSLCHYKILKQPSLD